MDGFTLCSCSSPPLGITCSHDFKNSEPQVVVTFSRLGAQLFNLSDRSLIKTWTLKPGSSFSCAALRHPRSGQYYAVENNNTLCSWAQDTDNLLAAQRHSLGAGVRVRQLHASPASDAIVVVTDEARVLMCQLSSQGGCEITTVSDKNQQGEWVASSFDTVDKQAVLAVVRRQADASHVLDLYYLDGASSSTAAAPVLSLLHSHPLSPSDLSAATLLSFAFQLSSRTLSLLWSSSEWQTLQFRTTGPLLTALSHEPTLVFARPVASLAHQPAPASVFVGLSALAMVSAPSSSPSSDSKKSRTTSSSSSTVLPLLSSWETLYGTLQDSQTLPVPLDHAAITTATASNEDSKQSSSKKSRATVTDTTTSFSRFVACVLDGQVVVMLPRAIYVAPLSLPSEKPSLAQAMGRLTSTLAFLQSATTTAPAPIAAKPASASSSNSALQPQPALIALPSPLHSLSLVETLDAATIMPSKKKNKKKQPADALASALSNVEGQARSQWQQLVLHADQSEQAVLAQLIPGYGAAASESKKESSSGSKKKEKEAKPLSSEEFARVFAEFLAAREAQVQSLSQASASSSSNKRKSPHHDPKAIAIPIKRSNPSSSSLSSSLPLSLHFVQSVAQYLVREPALLSSNGGSEVMRQLLMSDALSAQLLVELIPTLVELQHTELLACCLSHVHDLSESDVVAVLCYALELGSEQKKQADKAESLIHLVVSAPRSDVMLMEALKDLTMPQVLALLSYLHKWVQRYWQSFDRAVRSSSASTDRIPSFTQVVEWCTIVLDARFPQLLLLPVSSATAPSSDTHRALTLLRSLHSMISSHHLELCQQMTALRTLLSQYLKPAKKQILQAAQQAQNQAAALTDYSISVLHL